MRLSEVLSKPSTKDFIQIEDFLGDKRSKPNTHKYIIVGKIGRNYFCENCNDTRTFLSNEKLSCIIVSTTSVSISCVLLCPCCESRVFTWFLVECNSDIFLRSPHIRIRKYYEELSEKVLLTKNQDFAFSELLEKAERAYLEGLGTGSIVYLRKIYEQITVNMARTVNIDTSKSNGKRKTFKDLLREVDEHCSIIPKEFSENGYRLFSELSEVLHGDYNDEEGLKKYEALRRLILGIISNIKNNKELTAAIESLGWNKNGSNENE